MDFRKCSSSIPPLERIKYQTTSMQNLSLTFDLDLLCSSELQSPNSDAVKLDDTWATRFTKFQNLLTVSILCSWLSYL